MNHIQIYEGWNQSSEESYSVSYLSETIIKQKKTTGNYYSTSNAIRVVTETSSRPNSLHLPMSSNYALGVFKVLAFSSIFKIYDSKYFINAPNLDCHSKV